MVALAVGLGGAGPGCVGQVEVFEMGWWAWVERPCPGGWVSRRVSGRILSLFEGLELVGPNNQTKPLKAVERGQGRASQGSVGHAKALWMGRFNNPHHWKTSPPYPGTNTPAPPTCTLNWKEPTSDRLLVQRKLLVITGSRCKIQDLLLEEYFRSRSLHSKASCARCPSADTSPC